MCICKRSFYLHSVLGVLYFIFTSSNKTVNCYKQNFLHYDVIIKDLSSYNLKPFWKSTGLCPGDPHQEADKYLLSSDLKQNLFHVGSLPYKGITQVRIHWLLNLVHIHLYPNSSISYDLTSLDELIFQLWRNHLYPGFELMGNPSNYFNDFENKTQVYMWRDFVKTVAKHYINLYGISYLMKWNFESWNEPDHHDFDNLNFTIQGFLNYYDACSEGLRLADDRLKLGGPGGSCRIPSKGHSPICWALLEHCIKGKNFFTGKIGNRLDFISFHKKGNASSLDILNEESETIEYMRNFAKVPKNMSFYNDEADPLKNWARPLSWRADATYGAMVTKIILSHIFEYYMKSRNNKVHFDLLSNDNAFLSYYPHQFTQRTLLGRFQVNNTHPKYVEFIKKPVYSIFGLLSQLCPQILLTEIYKGDIQAEQDVEKMEYITESLMNMTLSLLKSTCKPIKPVTDFGVVSTQCSKTSKQIVVIMYNSADATLSNTTFSVDLLLNLSTSNDKNDAKGIALEINNVNTNPYLKWLLLGKPSYPTTEEFSLIKGNEEPHVTGPWDIKNLHSLKIHFQMSNPSVSLINICLLQINLKMVEYVRFFRIKQDTLQISWTDDYNKCVLTYIVEYSLYSSGPFVQLNKNKIIFPSYRHSVKEDKSSINGFYRIYAVDFWQTFGPYSRPFKYNESDSSNRMSA